MSVDCGVYRIHRCSLRNRTARLTAKLSFIGVMPIYILTGPFFLYNLANRVLSNFCQIAEK